MLFDLRLYRNTIQNQIYWTLQPQVYRLGQCFNLTSFCFSAWIFNIENLQDSKLFNYFYLTRYFLGTPLSVFASKKYFVLGKTYYNLHFGFYLNNSRLDFPLSVLIYQIQPTVNYRLTRDYVLSVSQFQWTLRDPSIFSERKTNSGLFDLQDPLVFTLHYRQPLRKHSVFFTKKLVSSLKFIF